MNRYDSEKILQDLVALGRKKHKLTNTEIMNAFSKGDFKEEQIDNFYIMCEEENIEIIDNVEDAEIAENKIEGVNYSDSMPCDDSFKIYLSDIAKVSLLTKEQEQELGRLLKEGSESEKKWARKKLIESNVRLVVYVVKYYSKTPRGRRSLTSYSERVSNGNVGLLQAVEHFDYKKGFRFSTYASNWIYQTISRFDNDNSSIHIPYNKEEEIIRMKKISASFAVENGREPTISEIAALMEISERKVRNLILCTMEPVSLNKTLNDDDDGSELIEFVSDKESNKNHYSEDVENKILVEEILKKAESYLTERDLDIISMRLGLNGGVVYSLDEVSKKYKLTRERIRQLESGAMSKLIRHNRHNNEKKKT